MAIVTGAIQTAIDIVAERLTKISDEKIQRLEKNSQIDSFLEAVCYQDLQARSHALGIISTDNALWLYNILGCEAPSPEVFSKASLPERIVALEMFACLIK